MFRPAMAIIKFFSKTLYEVLYSFCNGVLIIRRYRNCCILLIKKLHVSAGNGHHQVFFENALVF